MLHGFFYGQGVAFNNFCQWKIKSIENPNIVSSQHTSKNIYEFDLLPRIATLPIMLQTIIFNPTQEMNMG